MVIIDKNGMLLNNLLSVSVTLKIVPRKNPNCSIAAFIISDALSKIADFTKFFQNKEDLYKALVLEQWFRTMRARLPASGAP